MIECLQRNPQLNRLLQLGQSIWYDDLSRSVLNSGALTQLITAGVTGLTSNPTIFHKAITNSSDYDSDLRESLAQGKGAEEIVESLMVADVQAAADLLGDVYDSSEGRDGYASLEVSPFIANDTDETISAGKRLWALLDRPNVMIKVPATKAGLPAISALISEGININVTLIFSVKRYQEVMAAYQAGLAKRASTSKSNRQIASVASFFVSRVDSLCEQLIADKITAGTISETNKNLIIGRVGIENCVMAYQAFQQFATSDTWQNLISTTGATLQRPLWASTGTKNPDFSPLLYVEQLVAANSVNTLPPSTLAKLLENADLKLRLDASRKPDLQVFNALEEVDINLDLVCEQLEAQGVSSFSKSYEQILADVTKRMAQMRGER